MGCQRWHVEYDWVVELVGESFDILDTNHFPTLAEAMAYVRGAPHSDNEHYDVALCCYLVQKDTDTGEVLDNDPPLYAYMMDGQLETALSDGTAVPKRFIKEAEDWARKERKEM